MKKGIFDKNTKIVIETDFKKERVKALITSVLFTLVVGFITWLVGRIVQSNPGINIVDFTLSALPIFFIISIMYRLGKFINISTKNSKQ